MPKRVKSFLSVLLAMLMLLTVVPSATFSAFAAEKSETAASENAEPQLSVKLTTDKSSYAKNSTVIYTVTVTNRGTVGAADVVVRNYADAAFRNKGYEKLSFGDIPAGESVSKTVKLQHYNPYTASDNANAAMSLAQLIFVVIKVVIGEFLGAFSPTIDCKNVTVDGESIGMFSIVSYGGIDNTKKTEKIVIDKEALLYNDKLDAYSVDDGKNEITGSIVNNTDINSISYTITDDHGILIFRGSAGVADKWKIDDYSLCDGLNYLSVSAKNGEGKVFTAQLTLYSACFYNYENSVIDTADDDSDGLTNYQEAYFGSDPTSPDTDADSISDFDELNAIGTDPTKSDSDDNGITDEMEDTDGDGIINKDEFALGTNPAYYDTDHDLLSDYDELYVYHTDPLKDDTDGDGAKDGDEIHAGTDPLVAETEFADTYNTGDVSEDNPVSAQADVVTDAAGAASLEIAPVTYSDNPLVSGNIPGLLGSAFNFSVEGELKSAVITFSYDTALGTIGEDFQPRIYYLNESTGELEELPDQKVEDGKVSVTVEHFSTYLLLNKVEFDKVWEEEILPPDISGGASDKTGLDVVFVIDSSGSMTSNDSKGLRKTAAKNFIDKLGENDRAAVVDFDSYSSLYCAFTNDHDLLHSAVDRINSSGGTSLSAGISLALAQYTSDDYTRTDAYKYVIMLTDGDGSYNSSYTTLAAENDIIIYTVGLGSGVRSSVLKQIAEGTGGKYYFVSQASGLEDIYKEIEIETIDYVTDSNNDGISDYYTALLNSGTLRLSNGSNELVGCTDMFGLDSDDWDEDGLLNGEEIQIVSTPNRVEVKMISNPIDYDSDGDGYSDYTEVKVNHTDPLRMNFLKGSVSDFVNDDYFYYSIMNDNSEGLYTTVVTHVFDWDKTQESEQKLIDYFYDYASDATTQANAESIARLTQREQIADVLSGLNDIVSSLKDIADAATEITYDSEKIDKEIEKINNKKKGIIKAKNDADKKKEKTYQKALSAVKDSYSVLDSTVNIANDFKDAVTAFGGVTSVIATIAGSTQKVVSVAKKVNSGIHIPVPKSFMKVANKYQTWMGKNVIGEVSMGTTIGIAFDAVSFATVDVPEICNTYAKLTANMDAFEEYVLLIEYVSTHGNGHKYVKDAAGNVLKAVLEKSEGNINKMIGVAIGKKAAGKFISTAIDIVGDYVAVVKVLKTTLELALKISGLGEMTGTIVELQVNASISDACLEYFFADLGTEGSFYVSNDSANTQKYLTQLVQSRIDGENTAIKFLNSGGVAKVITDGLYWMTGQETSSERINATKDWIKTLYREAKNFNITLSEKLPFYSQSFSGGGGGGGGGGAF